MKKTSLNKMLATAVTTLGLLGVAVFGGAGTAVAGTNGQQIKFIDSKRTVLSLWVEGNNQNGEYWAHCFPTLNYTNYLSGYWYKGDVRLYAYTTNTNCDGVSIAGHAEYYIPEYYGSDWFTVDDERWW
jgi:hypothetical protein